MLDPDGDGLSNLEEYQFGTNPFSQDSDGDGLDDGLEVYDFGSNPLRADYTNYVVVSEIPGAATASRLGTWVEDGDSLCSVGLRGGVTYNLTIPTGDIYRIEVEGGDCETWKTLNSYELKAAVGGAYLGRQILFAQTNGIGRAGFFTPWMTAGVYTLSLEWDNASDARRLSIHSIRLIQLDGADTDEDGRKDWVKNRLARLSGLDSPDIFSAISPACVEGRDPFAGLIVADSGVMVQPGIEGRWYANVPLDPTNTIARRFEFQHGGLISTCLVTWSVTDVLTNTATLSIRLNDALKLSSYPSGATSGTHSIMIGGSSNYIGIAAGTAVAHTFTSTGSYLISGAYYPDVGPAQYGAITVVVYSAVFEQSPACWHLVSRPWTCSGISTNVSLESGTNFTIEEDTYAPPRTFILTALTPEEHGIVARLGSEGPILASTNARVFRFGADSDTGFTRLGACSSGLYLYENPFVLSPLLNDLTIQGKVIIGGVMYEDGGITNQWLPAQFDETGVLNVRFIKYLPGAFCNVIDIYQGTNFIGRHNTP